MTILKVNPGILLYGIRVSFPDRWAGIFLGTVGIVVWGTGEGKSDLEAREAKIRREARQRCLDEIIAFSNGQKIEHGIGVDITRAYLLAMANSVSRVRTGCGGYVNGSEE